MIEENDDFIVLKTNGAEIKLEKDKIASNEEILDCSDAIIGQYIQTPQGVYIKVDAGTFRLVKGPYTSPMSLTSIQEGVYITHEDTFPPQSTE